MTITDILPAYISMIHDPRITYTDGVLHCDHVSCSDCSLRNYSDCSINTVYFKYHANIHAIGEFEATIIAPILRLSHPELFI